MLFDWKNAEESINNTETVIGKHEYEWLKGWKIILLCLSVQTEKPLRTI